MMENTIRPSAKIYQFPDRRAPKTKDSKADPALIPAAGVLIGGWYHDEAIVEAVTGPRVQNG